VAPVVLPGCWAGTIGAVTGLSSSSGGGGGSATLDVSEVRVLAGKTPPAQISFRLSGVDSTVNLDIRAAVGVVEGDPNAVPLRCAFTGTEPEQSIGAFLVSPDTLTSLQATGAGTVHTLGWRYDDQLGDASFRCVQLRIVETTYGIDRTVTAFVGNDPPFIASIPGTSVTPSDPDDPLRLDEGEIVGDVRVDLRVADSSNDRISIDVEFAVLDGPGPPVYARATPVGTPLDDVQVFRNPTTQIFLWDAARDLPAREANVTLRFTPFDGARDGAGDPVPGASVDTPPFAVDNNARPRALLSSDVFVFNPDLRRGIPIPFSVVDTEGDLVDVVFQWTFLGQPFADPGTAADLRASLQDPFERRRLRIATESPVAVGGGVVPVDAASVRLPEIATSASTILGPGGVAPDLVGRELEIHRRPLVPPRTAGSGEGELVSPRTALALPSGLSALVLDEPSPGAWRLAQVRLADLSIETEVAAPRVGVPDTMTRERGGDAVLVATSDEASRGDSVWRIFRVEDGVVIPLLCSDQAPAVERGPVRGLASLGPGSAVFTVGGSLVELRYHEAFFSAFPVLSGLDAPWGVVIDPRRDHSLFLAERGSLRGSSGRLLAVDVEHRQVEEIAAGAFPHPRALAVEEEGPRLLVLTDDEGVSGEELRGLRIGPEEVPFLLLPEPGSSGAGYEGEIGDLTVGPDGLRLLALPGLDTVTTGGGLEQVRTITAFDRATQVATVDLPFAPPIARQAYLIRDRADRVRARASGNGASDVFVWDTGDVLPGGNVLVRVLALDRDLGAPAASAVSRVVKADADVSPCTVLEPNLVDVGALVVADLDSDGDLDLAVTNDAVGNSNVTLFFQEPAGVFSTRQVLVQVPGSIPFDVATGELTGDSLVDVVVANFGSANNLAIFPQISPGVFSDKPISLVVPEASPAAVSVADLDGDGDLDLVSANFGGDTVRIFYQEGPGAFVLRDPPLGGAGVTVGPESSAVGDLDGNGLVDIVVGNSLGDDLTVFYQTAPDVFETQRLGSRNLTNSPLDVKLADVDGDGRLDIVSANRDGNDLTIFFQEDARVYLPLRVGSAAVSLGPDTLDIADLDRDGDLDLVVANEDGSTLAIFFQTAPRSFDPRLLELPLFDPRAVGVGDLDGDGAVDIVSASTRADGTLTFFFQTARGRFEPRVRNPVEGCPPTLLPGTSILAPDSLRTPLDLSAADADGDGDLDLFCADVGSSAMALFLQTSPGLFSEEPLLLTATSLDQPGSLATGDLDGDGDQDVVVSSLASSMLTVFLRGIAGGYTAASVDLDPGALARVVEVADVDGDAALDIVASLLDFAAGDSIVVYYNDGQDPPGFLLGTRLGPVSFPRGIAVADVDGDGRLDIVSANELDDSVTIFRQTSPRLFGGVPQVLRGVSLPLAVVAGDVEGDGDIDLVCVNASSSNRVVLFRQREGGIFDRLTLDGAGGGAVGAPTDVVLFDLDGDGNLDVITCQGTSDDLAFYRQLGGGLFAPRPTRLFVDPTLQPGVFRGPAALVAADLDGDGDPDLVTANQESGSLTVFYSSH